MTPEEKHPLLKQMKQMQGTLFERYITEELKKTDVELRYADSETFKVLQGRAKTLSELLEMISTAGQELARIERPKPDMRNSF